MKKRSAMFVAAGLVLAMIVAGVGFAMGMTGPTADAKRAPLQVKASKQKPIVHTVTKTITIHKKAKATDDGPVASTPVIVGSTAPASTTDDTASSTSSSDGYENESESESSEHGSESDSDSSSQESSSGSTSSGEGGDD
ncbi:MAG: hypothetical protein ACM3OO_02040 [Planctomycetaceae bacterium]